MAAKIEIQYTDKVNEFHESLPQKIPKFPPEVIQGDAFRQKSISRRSMTL